jgi:hypothetical protein
MCFTKYSSRSLAVIMCGAAMACADNPGPDPTNELELITTVNLIFAPTAGSSISAKFADRDGPGGAEPTIIHPSPLAAGTTYTLEIELLNESETPPEDITEEVKEEAEDHQIFLQGTALGGLLAVMYADRESDYTNNSVGSDLPVGLKWTVAAMSPGSGALQVILKHQPPINDQPVKTESSSAEDGDTDVDVSFDVTVQ